MSLGRDFWLKIVFLFFKLEFDGRGDPNFALGGMSKRSKGCSFWSSGGRSPLSLPAEMWTPRRPQTIILVLGHPPINILGLETIPDTLGGLQCHVGRAGEHEKLKKGDFRAKSLIWSGFGAIWRDLKRFGEFSSDLGWFRRENHSGAPQAAPKHYETLLWDLYRPVGGVGRS